MTVRYLVRGRVQGVGFRNFVSRHALRLGLAGWVANLPDGRVEVVVRGEEEPVWELEQLLRRGPQHAQVEQVDISEISDEAAPFNSFRISY